MFWEILYFHPMDDVEKILSNYIDQLESCLLQQMSTGENVIYHTGHRIEEKVNQLQKGLDKLVAYRTTPPFAAPGTVSKIFYDIPNDYISRRVVSHAVAMLDTFLRAFQEDQELKKLLKKPDTKKCDFPEYRNWAIINLLLNNGCRAATIRNIQIKDVDMDNKVIYLRHTKNKRAQVIPLCEALCGVLREYIRVRGGDGVITCFPTKTAHS